MKKAGRRITLSSETLRVLDPKSLEKAAGDSLVTTTTMLPGCVKSVNLPC
jgi:hypothetical protein